MAGAALNLTVVRALAGALLAGEASAETVAARCRSVLGGDWPWVGRLAKRYAAAFGHGTRPRKLEVVRFLLADARFRDAWRRYGAELKVSAWPMEPQGMLPVAAAEGWMLPEIGSVGALAEWMGVTPGELEWFADLKGIAAKEGAPLGHYRYRVLAKGFGRVRLIEAPKERLKSLQRRVLAGILEGIPMHPAVHGFVKGRSIRTFVEPHVGRRVVVRMDLEDFFPTIGGRRVQALFRTMGYPEGVADALGGICTTATPRAVWREPGIDADAGRVREARALYGRVHVPQGAPSSPAVANACGFRLDARLSGLAAAAGARYTRYADDLAFSGDAEFVRSVDGFAARAGAIASEEGFAVNFRKTRVMRQGVRQHLAGLVANEKVNVMREDYDRLKATLTNCVRHGQEGQNRERVAAFREHLAGRVGFVESVNAAKGARLRQILERIDWASG